jgi:hypothetical protein
MKLCNYFTKVFNLAEDHTLFSAMPDWPWGQRSPQFNGYRVSFLGVKRQRCEVDHSPPSSAEVRNEWSYTSTPPYIFMACIGTTFLLRLYVITLYF